MDSLLYHIREARPHEYQALGEIMVSVYSNLEGFPTPEEQPDYFNMLANIGNQVKKPSTKLVVAATTEGHILGGVVYIGEMQYYGSGGTATLEKNSSGFRLLAVDPSSQNLGIGRALSLDCIKRARDSGRKQVIIHSTKVMQVAWNMYQRLGFERSTDLDFTQGELPVFGFRLMIS